MKTTGIVRRIDDLGRVVIPKEIRRRLNIKDGDPLEIYFDNKGGVTFRKYQTPTESIAELCAKLVSHCVKSGWLVGTYFDGDTTTVITPKGTATAKKNPSDTYDANVGVCAALAKLGYINMPDGLN